MATLSNKRHHLAREKYLTATNSYLIGCVDLITHIQNGGRVADTDFELLMRTVRVLELLLQCWKGRNSKKVG